MGYNKSYYERNKDYFREYNRKNKEKRRIQQRNFARENRKRLNDLKNKPCEDCGIQYPTFVMDFHHVNPEEKSFSISGSVNRSLESINNEISKCVLLCANCHRIREHGMKNIKSIFSHALMGVYKLVRQ